MDESTKDLGASMLQLLQRELEIQQDLVSYLQSRQYQYQQELKDAPAQHREFVHGQLFEIGKLLPLVQNRRADVYTSIVKLKAEASSSSSPQKT